MTTGRVKAYVWPDLARPDVAQPDKARQPIVPGHLGHRAKLAGPRTALPISCRVGPTRWAKEAAQARPNIRAVPAWAQSLRAVLGLDWVKIPRIAHRLSVPALPGVAVSRPGSGHLVPMLELARLFLRRGLAVVVVEPPDTPSIDFHVLTPPQPGTRRSGSPWLDGGRAQGRRVRLEPPPRRRRCARVREQGLRWWTTDRVVSFEGWIEYCKGASSSARGVLDEDRCSCSCTSIELPMGDGTCVTDGGTIKLVNVARADGEITSKCRKRC
ncbi:hypothetical protein HU200_018947 [Digitaria exilis]|uniref:Uncharacterized protein n=1 Tax=Digitaria exilis TaxID=1010633 RepID=A0A835KG18_9POAL|nr:hypothetical protein HU200_018947 [Digitaria exilis]